MRSLLVLSALFVFAVVGTAADKFTPEELRAETEFLADKDSPKVFTMDKALEVSKLTGKPVLCWMGEHAFADANARRLSQELKDDTVQASMAADGSKYDQFNPRVKFDSAQYANGGRTYFIRASEFKFESGSTSREETTGYKILKMFRDKEQPAGKDPLAK